MGRGSGGAFELWYKYDMGYKRDARLFNSRFYSSHAKLYMYIRSGPLSAKYVTQHKIIYMNIGENKDVQ